MSTTRPLDLSWDPPLPHALTPTLTYLSPPTPLTQCAIIALHGRGDNARDFADTFVPHLQHYFGITSSGGASGREGSGVKLTLRAVEAQDGAWFGTHTPQSEADLAFQGPYVHSSLLKIKDEIESLNDAGIPASKVVIVGFSQGAILVNSYLIRALDLLATGEGQLPLPKHFLGWAGTCFNFETTFPEPGWPVFTSDEKNKAEQGQGEEGEYDVWSHNQCGSSDRYFTASQIQEVTGRIASAAAKVGGKVRVRVSSETEPGAHSVLPGMIAKLIQMVESVVASS